MRPHGSITRTDNDLVLVEDPKVGSDRIGCSNVKTTLFETSFVFDENTCEAAEEYSVAFDKLVSLFETRSLPFSGTVVVLCIKNTRGEICF